MLGRGGVFFGKPRAQGVPRPRVTIFRYGKSIGPTTTYDQLTANALLFVRLLVDGECPRSVTEAVVDATGERENTTVRRLLEFTKGEKKYLADKITRCLT